MTSDRPRGATPRRTQRERREQTVTTLIDAAIATVAEIGYSRSSVSEICGRAGISHGGLFRHFDTRLDLMVAAAEEVAERQLIVFIQRFGATPRSGQTISTMLRLIRDAARSPTSAVWFELLTAARTDVLLRDRLAPVTRRYYQRIRISIEDLPSAEGFSRHTLDLVLRVALHFLDGEAVVHKVVPDPEGENEVLDLLAELLTHAADQTP